MPSKFPGPYINDVKVDTSTMVYVQGGNFGKMDIGARSSGMPKNIKNSNSISHVGDATPGSVSNKFPA